MARVKTEALETNWLWRLTYSIGPDLLFLSAFATILGVLMFLYRGKFTFDRTSIIFPLLILMLLIGIAFARNAKKIWSSDSEERRQFTREALNMVRDWLPLSTCILVYENFHDLTNLIRPDVVDGTLRALDEKIFGVEPTIALQKIITPWLTEYMTFAYALYFVFPVMVLALLYRENEFTKFREFGLALTMTFYLGLTGYMLVPAIGPRYFMEHEFTVPLDGIWLTSRAAAAWNNLETIQRDCFPSLHTAMTCLSLIYMVRFRKIWRHGGLILAICTPLIVSLWCSTIYLRYHYFVDVMGGWALSIFCSRVAPAFIRWYYTRKTVEAPVMSTEMG